MPRTTIIDYIAVSPTGGYKDGPVEVALKLSISDTEAIISWQPVGSNPVAFRAIDHDSKLWSDAPSRTVRRDDASRGFGLPAELPHFVATRAVAVLADLHWREVLIEQVKVVKAAARDRGPHVYMHQEED
jgi:hypothetical protein